MPVADYNWQETAMSHPHHFMNDPEIICRIFSCFVFHKRCNSICDRNQRWQFIVRGLNQTNEQLFNWMQTIQLGRRRRGNCMNCDQQQCDAHSISFSSHRVRWPLTMLSPSLHPHTDRSTPITHIFQQSTCIHSLWRLSPAVHRIPAGCLALDDSRWARPIAVCGSTITPCGFDFLPGDSCGYSRPPGTHCVLGPCVPPVGAPGAPLPVSRRLKLSARHWYHAPALKWRHCWIRRRRWADTEDPSRQPQDNIQLRSWKMCRLLNRSTWVFILHPFCLTEC